MAGKQLSEFERFERMVKVFKTLTGWLLFLCGIFPKKFRMVDRLVLRPLHDPWLALRIAGAWSDPDPYFDVNDAVGEAIVAGRSCRLIRFRFIGDGDLNRGLTEVDWDLVDRRCVDVDWFWDCLTRKRWQITKFHQSICTVSQYLRSLELDDSIQRVLIYWCGSTAEAQHGCYVISRTESACMQSTGVPVDRAYRPEAHVDWNWRESVTTSSGLRGAMALTLRAALEDPGTYILVERV